MILGGVWLVKHVGRDGSAGSRQGQAGAGECVNINLRDQAQARGYWWLCAVACGQPGSLRLSRTWLHPRWVGVNDYENWLGDDV